MSHPETDVIISGSRQDVRDQFKNRLKHLVHSALKRKGKLQIILIVLLSLNSMIVGINHTITTFHTYVPHFHCRDQPSTTCGIAVNENPCPSGYDFDESDDRSLAVEFETVCDRAMLGPLINSLYFLGVTLGSLICSCLCDVYGRRNLVILCLYGQAVMAFGQYFATNLSIFIVFRILQGFFVQGLQTCSYTLIMEYCPSRYRTIAATYWESNWAVGLAILAGVAHFIREWRLLTLTLALPAFCTILYIWFIPESIVWLEAKGDYPSTLNLLRKVATFNDDSDIVEQCNSISLDNTSASYTDDKSKCPTDEANKTNFSIIIKHPILRKHLLSMVCIWFSVTLSYYGILYYLPNLAGQRHLNFGFGALIELIAYILAYFVLTNFGRRIPMAFYQYCNGFLILTIAVLANLPKDTAASGWIVIITLVAKSLSVSSFCGMFIYCSELLPTICRGLGLGLCGCAARFGSLLAPQLMALLNVLPQFVPLSVMTILLLISATVTLFLPETLMTVLPNTIAEVDETWGNKKLDRLDY